MNKQQRKRLNELIEQVEGIVTEIEEMAEEEQDKYDNYPENMQNSDQATAIEEAADNLREAASDLSNWCDEVRSNLEV